MKKGFGRMLRIVLVVVAAAIAAVLGYAATRPDAFVIKRTAVIAGRPAVES